MESSENSKKTISKDTIWNTRVVLIVSAILLVFSIIYHFNFTDGISFSPDIYVSYQKKSYDTIFQPERDISYYSCDLRGDRDASFRVMVFSFKLSPKERDHWLKNSLKSNEKRTSVNGYPAYRKQEEEGGGQYVVFTNNICYNISFDKQIGETREQEVLKNITISGGDMSFRYYLGEGFYLIFALCAISLILFSAYTKRYKKEGRE